LKFLRRSAVVARHLSPQTTALHLWASNKRELGLRHDGVPPKGSYFAELLARHGVQPEAAPLTGRGRRVFDAGLIASVPLDSVDRFADIGGTGQALALAAWGKWRCAIVLVDIDAKGRWSVAPSDWVTLYRQFLTDNGVPFDLITVVSKPDDLVPAQLVTNLAGFGDEHNIKPLGAVLDQGLAPGGCLITDIRKGSGAYPFLKPRGTIIELSRRDDSGAEVHRVLLTAHPQQPALEPESDWAKIATELAGKDGFYRDSGDHAMLFVKRSDTLVVTFDNLDIAMEKREDKRPWGYAFVEKQGWSMLGVTAAGWTWFRDPWVYAQFDALKSQGFFKQFKRVVFYGASMGGYGACAFAAACPGADVVAISPQSTLDKAVVPFETRYKTAWDRDFSGRYGDAAQVSASAGRVTLIYDPYEPLDRGHVDRFSAANVVKLRAPLLGHRVGSSLQQMGILSSITLGAVNGTLTEAAFYQKLRARKGFGRYQKELFNRAIATGHPELARRMGRWVLTHGGNRHIRKAMEKL
jgi:hypothetical protein